MWRKKSGRSEQMSNVIEDDSVDDDSFLRELEYF
jgi:hypothetical protein